MRLAACRRWHRRQATVERDMTDNTKSIVPAQEGGVPETPTWRHVVPTSAEPAAEMLPDESLKKHSIAGWIVLAIFFGGFGAWAATAPLNGAVVAEAVVKVEGNRKSLQHLEGGIVKEVKVKEGAHVKAGDVLIVLDDTKARSDFDVFSQQQLVFRATAARLTAELNRASTLTPPAEIASQLDDPDVRDVWNAQQQQFRSRMTSLEGARQVLREKINQLEEQIGGNTKQVATYKLQTESG